ncbi:leucine-rich repeat protein 1 isoform X2 [Hypanus sabinus]|uniref:leucine-rich repeat protein 1 isoform X2 n=1 Tax=Hypanus sabinus TaxID=79690 RepID=UPI0028C3C598|nr:leucine-rich repeat protein 1 isoform X2 [Hypanus sabinus]
MDTMKLQCEVEVINRMLPTFGMRNRGKGNRAVLSIGKQNDRGIKNNSATIHLLICTIKDKSGCKYKLKENIEQFFTKFVEEGKATIRLKEPAVDVCLNKADVNNLRNFLSALRLAHRGSEIDSISLSNLTPVKTSEVEKPKTKMVITSRKDYPITTNFPYSLEFLQVSFCKLARVDMRMLCLRRLRKLDLSNNHIRKLPATIGDLACLSVLVLHNNYLETFSIGLCNSTLQKSLQFLDLSHNHLRALPLQFCQLQELVHLKLDDNELVQLPYRIGQLTKLRFLTAARNKLPYLPCDFQLLCLENVDLFGNPFEHPNPLIPTIHLQIPMTLLESAARATINYRIAYGPHVLPAHLCQDLDLFKRCLCRRPCLNSFIQIVVNLNLHQVSHTVVLVDNMGGTEAPILYYFCSLTCYSQFLDKYQQRNR